MKYGLHTSTASQITRLLQATGERQNSLERPLFRKRSKPVHGRHAPHDTVHVRFSVTLSQLRKATGSASIHLYAEIGNNDLHHPYKCLAVLPSCVPAPHQSLFGIDSHYCGFCKSAHSACFRSIIWRMAWRFVLVIYVYPGSHQQWRSTG
jgi:hypothetical protein